MQIHILRLGIKTTPSIIKTPLSFQLCIIIYFKVLRKHYDKVCISYRLTVKFISLPLSAKITCQSRPFKLGMKHLLSRVKNCISHHWLTPIISLCKHEKERVPECSEGFAPVETVKFNRRLTVNQAKKNLFSFHLKSLKIMKWGDAHLVHLFSKWSRNLAYNYNKATWNLKSCNSSQEEKGKSLKQQL